MPFKTTWIDLFIPPPAAKTTPTDRKTTTIDKAMANLLIFFIKKSSPLNYILISLLTNHIYYQRKAGSNNYSDY